jgi:N-acetyl sugar amidotransferase
MRKCVRCGLPQTYETIEYDEAGVCNVCRNHERKDNVDWIVKSAELGALIDQYRGKYDYDCIVPFSGGKDSTYTLWHLIHHYKVKPLVVQFNHGFLRPNLLANNERTLKKLGVDFLSFQGNWRTIKRVMLEALIRKGDFCIHCHWGVFAYPMQVALKYQVPLLIWGERSTEFTNYYKPDEVEEVDETRFDRFVNLGITAEDMAGMIKRDFDFDFRDLKPFTYPKASDLRKLGVRSVCLGSYIRWDTQKQSQIISKELGWQGDEVEGVPLRYSFTKVECSMQGVRDYLKFLKRGYSRVTQMTAQDLRDGRIEPSQAKALIKQYEGKRPASLDLFLDYLGITEDEFNGYVAATVVPPHVPDFGRETGIKPHDFEQWYREPAGAP